MFTRSLKVRLLLVVVTVLVLTQTITALWLWHESQEQVAILVQADLSDAEIEAKIEHEKMESVLAFVLPALFCVGVSVGFLYFLIRRLTEPLEHLAQGVNQRSTHDLAVLPLEKNASAEVITIVDSTNRLLQRIALGLEHERRFTADVAHELRTPLAGIRMHLELLTSESPETMTLLIRRIDDLMQLTDQLLQLARASQQSRAGLLGMERLDVVAHVCVPLQQEFEWYDDIETEWQLPCAAYCVASAPLLQIALKNLLENARKYAGERPVIKVAVLAEGEDWVVQVSDNGLGVAPELLGQLTDSFFRADQVKQGYGLGLSIVKRIADLHQAELSLHNVAGGGLQVLLKLKRADALQWQEDDSGR
ncbi:ATP-binding protein [Vitreoscilla massiliensis]|uniref:histidine kinase n=1 Tax=Vitreoscilla massiliensis TaxID=1689272 RepID=A0ABY4DZ56_9NEIS|nr:ATP-binding protein [Vitreoscilla massiliensis]UOO88401.1 ATP-binding protein [Vitreoscilla massiliensis]